MLIPKYNGRYLIGGIDEAKFFCHNFSRDESCYALEHDVLMFLKRSGFANCSEMVIEDRDIYAILLNFEEEKKKGVLTEGDFYHFKSEWLSKKYNYKEKEFELNIKKFSILSMFLSLLDTFFTKCYIRFIGRMILEFSSESGQSIDRGKNHYNIRFVSSCFFRFSRSNFFRLIFKRRSVKNKYIIIYYTKRQGVDFDSNVTGILSRKLMEEMFYRAAKGLFVGIYSRIDKIVVNEGLTFRSVAALRLARECGVPSTLKSHGGVVPGGGGIQSQVSSLLSEYGFNDHPFATHLQPRSEWQVVGTEKQYTIEKKFRKRNKVPCNVRFNILFAPSHHRFGAQVPSFSSTSFDVVRYAEAIAILAPDLGIDLGIRLKFSSTGRAKNEADSVYSVDREAVESICRMPHVYAANGDFLSELEKADLVVTAGNTAVVFDALDVGVPVAIILRNKNRYSFISVEDCNDGDVDNKRLFTVFSEENLADQLKMIINKIRCEYN